MSLTTVCFAIKSIRAYIAGHHNQPTPVITPLNSSNQTLLLFVHFAPTTPLPMPDKVLWDPGSTQIKIEIMQNYLVITLTRILPITYHFVSVLKLHWFKASSETQEYEINQGS